MSENSLINLLTERKTKIEQELNFIDQLLDVYDSNPDAPQEDLVFEYKPPKKQTKTSIRNRTQMAVLNVLKQAKAPLSTTELATRAKITSKQGYNALYQLRNKGRAVKKDGLWSLSS